MTIKDRFDYVASQARSLLGEDKPQVAIRLITKTIGSLSCPPSLALILAEAYFKEEMKKEASALIRQYVDSSPKSVLILKNAVNLYVQNMDYENALLYIDEAIKLFPLSVSFIADKAAILFKQGHIELAAGTLLKKLVYGKLVDDDISLIKDLRRDLQVLPQDSIVANNFLSHPEITKIYRRFTFGRGISLGTDCEFGYIQRAMGCEPLDLLRWGSIPFDSLIKLLDGRFFGFALSEAVYLKLIKYNDNGNWEYHFFDNSYSFGAHTYHNPVSMGIQATQEDILKKMRQHFLMLARKMQDDLEDADKYFVYKSPVILEAGDCKRLFDALNIYGENKLLIVMPKKDGLKYFEEIEPGLQIGRLDKYWIDAKIDTENIKAWEFLIHNSWDHFIKHYPYMDQV